jgi:ethanolamine utilization protein EutN
MFLARVKGHVVTTAKDPAFKGCKLLIVEPLKVNYDNDQLAANGGDVRAGGGAKSAAGRFEVTGRAIVAIDTLGAGENQLVLVAQGSSARMAEGCNKIPTDAVIIGLVDELVVMGHKIPPTG